MSRLCEGRVASSRGPDGASAASTPCCWRRTAPRSSSTTSAAAMDGAGRTTSPGQQVVDEIRGQAARPSPTATTSAAGRAPRRMIDAAIEHFGGLDVLVNNAGILRDRMLTNMAEERVGRGDQGAPEGHVRALRATPPPTGATQSKKTGGPVDGRIINTSVDVGHLRQRRPDQLRRGQGRHRRLHDHRRAGAAPLRRHRQRHRRRRR